MDGGPFRAQQPADRRVPSRPELTHRQSEEPQAEMEQNAVYPSVARSRATKQEKSVKRFIIPIVASIIVIALAIIGFFAWSNSQNSGAAIDGSKYQAVFFTNGQVYFGKLKSLNGESMQLTDIYYLQTQTSEKDDSENPQKTSTDQNNVQIIKLGDEIHGPEDKMIISKDQVLFYENLKPGGKVAQSIETYKKSN